MRVEVLPNPYGNRCDPRFKKTYRPGCEEAIVEARKQIEEIYKSMFHIHRSKMTAAEASDWDRPSFVEERKREFLAKCQPFHRIISEIESFGLETITMTVPA